MSAPASSVPPDEHGAVLYTARFVGALRVLQVIAVALAGTILLGTAGLLVLMAVLATDLEPLGRAGLVVVAVLLLLLSAPLLALTLRSRRLAMTVRAGGIEVRGYLRDRWLPWEGIAVIETSEHWYWRRATRIVTVDGERVTPLITCYQFLLLRGESYDEAARDPRLPLHPTRVAIDAHRRWLRGELDGGPAPWGAGPSGASRPGRLGACRA